MKNNYVIGVDFGSDSVRSVLINAQNGQEISTSVFYYPRWKQGLYCNAEAQQFRQHPLDYIEGLQATITNCLAQSGADIAANVRAISVDTTGSTPVAVNAQGVPLSLTPEFAENPNAMFVLWKDHTATKEAAEINEHATKFPINYLQYVGGIYSSEWYWAKLLRVFRADDTVRQATESWVEHCDWIPFLLTGGNDAKAIKRGICSAGHKGLYAAEFGGYPPNEFFATLDPLLDGFAAKVSTETLAANKAVGTISGEWAHKLGLPSDVVIGIGAFDCHMGAVGGQIEPYYLSKIVGTSTCDIMVAPVEDIKGTVKGICGQVPGSVIPGLMGLEAGQSAFGDAYAWFKNLISWPLQFVENEAEREKITTNIIVELAKQAEKIEVTETSELATDWFNGRRTPDANQLLKGTITNLHLGSSAPRVFRSIVEATCFGARAIVERFIEEGVQVKGIITLGGVARKSPFVMQMMADVINMPIKVHKSEQTCAAGAAMFAATAAGLYSTVEDAMQAMGQGFDLFYEPNPEKVAVFEARYQAYKQLGAFSENQTKQYNH